MNRTEHPEGPASPTSPEMPAAGPLPGEAGNGRTRAESESVPGLFRKLATDLSTLFQQELALAKSEMTHAVSDVKTGVSNVAIGGSVLYAGLLFLLGGVMLLLANWVELWVSALIVGAVVAIIGFILLQSGKKKMEASSLAPERTMDSVRKDTELARRKMQ